MRMRRRRVQCPSCGPKLERLSWLHRYARVTRRLADSVVRLCQQLPIKHVAAFYGLGWDTVKDLDKASLEERLGPPDLDGLVVLAMDEFAIHKGQRYATVVVEPRRKRVLWVGLGRDKECVRSFFGLLGPTWAAHIRAVAMDMHAAFYVEVQAQCPNAEIVFDLFHVVAGYGRQVLDRVRVDEAGTTNGHAGSSRAPAGCSSATTANITKLADRIRLTELLNANRAICKAYLMRDELRHLWTYARKVGPAAAGPSGTSAPCAAASGPLVAYAKRLAVHAHGIIAHARWPLHTSLLEGINNKIKVIKRMAYGLRDDASFFLKIRGAFPGMSG